MAMTDRQQEGLSKLLERLGDALLSIKSHLERVERVEAEAHKEISGQNSALMTEIKLLRQALDEARNDVARVRSDLTPVHGIPLPVHEEKSSGVAIGPVKMSTKAVGKLGKGLPWIAFGLLLALAIAVVVLVAVFKWGGLRVEPAAGVQETATPAGEEPKDKPLLR